MAVEAPESVLRAFYEGRMTPEDGASFRADVEAGLVTVPSWFKLEPIKAEETQVELIDEISLPDGSQSFGMGQVTGSGSAMGTNVAVEDTSPVAGPLGAEILDPLTGELRSTPEVEAAPDWSQMPELDVISTIGEGKGWQGFKTALGTMFANPDEMAKVFKANFPDIQVRKDSKGNYILKSSIDGKEYAIKPGFRSSDIPRVATAVAMGTVGPGAGVTGLLGTAGREAAIQGGIEATQAMTGGDFDTGEVAMAGALGAGGELVGQGLRALRGAPTPSPSAPSVTQEEAIAGLTQKAARSPSRRGDALAESADPNPEVVAAAERLGVTEHLQPDHISSNTAFQEMVQLNKSQAGSAMRKEEIEKFSKLSGEAVKIVEEMGATPDVGGLGDKIKDKLFGRINWMKNNSDKMYGRINSKIPRGTRVQADRTIEFLEDKADDMGGMEKLSAYERNIYDSLTDEEMPTYHYIDQLRKDVGNKANQIDQFADADTAKAKAIYDRLTEDQGDIANVLGFGNDWEAAKRMVRARKGVEDDMKSLFGKNLDQSLVSKFGQATNTLKKTDVDKFENLLNAIPKKNRGEVLASSLMTALGSRAQRGEMSFGNFRNWWEGVSKSSRARALLAKELPKGSLQKLDDLAKVSGAVSDAMRGKARGGATLQYYLNPADGMFSGLVDLARGRARSVPGGALVDTVGSMISKSQDDLSKSLEDLLMSDRFKERMIEAAKEGANVDDVALKMSRDKKLRNFMAKTRIGDNPSAIKNYLLAAMRVDRNIGDE